jgi:hypothetical protein
MLRNPDLNPGIVAAHFDPSALSKICALPETRFGREFDMHKRTTEITRGIDKGQDYHFFKDNGSSVLAVAHLDTVGPANTREAHFVNTEAGPVIFSRALDDRLGAYIILDLLPALGLEYDILLTVGEESGCSTAQFFVPDRQYDWMIEFDRGGTDVVMYQYEDKETKEMVEDCGAVVGDGIFSDICYLDHLDIKGFNWGVGYQDYHGPRAHAFINDTITMVSHYMLFHEQNEGTYMPHDDTKLSGRPWWSEYGDYLDDDDEVVELESWAK